MIDWRMIFAGIDWVAIFTGGLVIVGFFQLMVFGRQARRLRETIEKMDEIAGQQRADTQSLLEVTRSNAYAAAEQAAAMAGWRAAAEAQRDAIVIAQRAFLSIRDLSVQIYVHHSDRIVGYRIHVNVMNSGQTIARRYAHNINVVALDRVPDDFRYADRFPGASPTGTVAPGASTFLLGEVAIQDIVAAFDGRKEAIIYGWLEYDDVFETRHRTEFCMKIGVIADPRTTRVTPMPGGTTPSVLTFTGYGKYNSIDDDCVYRPGKTPLAQPGELPDITQPPKYDSSPQL